LQRHAKRKKSNDPTKSWIFETYKIAYSLTKKKKENTETKEHKKEKQTDVQPLPSKADSVKKPTIYMTG
jgi:hypothetical protein